MPTFDEVLSKGPKKQQPKTSFLKSIADVASNVASYIQPAVDTVEKIATYANPITAIGEAVEDVPAVGEAVKSVDKIADNAVEEVKTAIPNYIEGAIQGAKEVGRQAVNQAEIDPYGLASTEKASSEYGFPTPPEMQPTQEQKDALELSQKAQSTFFNETLAIPVMTISSILAPQATVGGFLGSLYKEGKEKTGTISGGLRAATYGGVVDWATQENLSQNLQEKPLATTISGILSAAPLFIEFGLAKSIKNQKIPKNPDVIYADGEWQLAEDYATNKTGKPLQIGQDTTINADFTTAETNAPNAPRGSYLRNTEMGKNIQPTETVKPSIKIEPLSDVNPAEYSIVKSSMQENGWQGRPVLLLDNANAGFVALTGAKRVQAAQELGVDVPSVVIKMPTEDVYNALPKDIQSSWQELTGAKTEEERLVAVTKLREQGQVSDEAFTLADAEQNMLPKEEAQQNISDKTNEGEQNYSPSSIKPGESTYESPVTKKEIVKDINDVVTMRTGRINNDNSGGIYKVYPEVIRLKKYGDFEVAAHEIGHHLDKKLNIEGFDDELITNADNNWGKNEIYQKYSKETKRAEGVAEFTFEYLLNPLEAKRNFPTYYDAFVEALAKDAKLQAKIENIGNKMRKYYSQSDNAKARAGVSFANETKVAIKDQISEVAHNIYTKLVDDTDPIGKVDILYHEITGQNLPFEKNPQSLARMARGTSVLRAELLVTGEEPGLVQAVLNDIYHGKLEHAVTILDILRGIKPAELNEKYPFFLKNGNYNDWEQAFSTLLVAKRSLEVKRVNYEEPLKMLEYSQKLANSVFENAVKSVNKAKQNLVKNQTEKHETLKSNEDSYKKLRNSLNSEYSKAVKDLMKVEETEAENIKKLELALADKEAEILATKEVDRSVVVETKELASELKKAQKKYEDAIKARVKAENKDYYKKPKDIQELQSLTVDAARAKRKLDLATAKRDKFIKDGYELPIDEEVAKNVIKVMPEELKALTQKFYDYYDNLLSIAEDSYLISAKTHDILKDKYQEYTNMTRDFSDEGKLVHKKLIAGLKVGGSSRIVVDPLESVIIDTYNTIREAENNKIRLTFSKLVNEPGIGALIEAVPGTKGSAAESIFTVLVEGKKQAFRTTPEIYKVITRMNAQMASDTVNMLAPFAKALRLGATMTPDFLVVNMIRDTVTAAIQTEGFIPVIGTMQGMADIAKGGRLLYEYKAAGVPMATFVGDSRPAIGSLLETMKTKEGLAGTSSVQVLNALIEQTRKVLEASETSTRIAIYQKARLRGLSIDEAGLVAKEGTVDFSRAGTIGRTVNKAVPFFNAQIQGIDRMLREFHNNPLPTFSKGVVYITLASLTLWALYHKEDWYKSAHLDVKNGNFLIKVGDTILRFRKPFEFGIIFGSSVERVLDAYYDKDPKAVDSWAESLVQGLTPSIMIAALGPIISWQSNFDFFTGRPIVPRRLQSEPVEKQYTENTTELAKKVGATLHLSPMQIDHFVRGYTASAGAWATSMGDFFIGDKKEKPAKKISELPGVRTFTYDPYKNPRELDDFYDKVAKMELEHKNDDDNAPVPKELRDIRKTQTQISKLIKENYAISDGEMSSEEKRSMIDENKALMLELAKQYLEASNEDNE